MISAIVAVDNNWGIGFNGKLLEHIPEDLKMFKQLTIGHTVIMGRKTWNSLPKAPLPKRGNIVISSAEPLIMAKNTLRLPLEDVIEFLEYTKDEVFIIGGGTIYKELLPLCDKVYVTKIFKDHPNIDTYFPNLDQMEDEWKLDNSEEIQNYNGINY